MRSEWCKSCGNEGCWAGSNAHSQEITRPANLAGLFHPIARPEVMRIAKKLPGLQTWQAVSTLWMELLCGMSMWLQQA